MIRQGGIARRAAGAGWGAMVSLGVLTSPALAQKDPAAAEKLPDDIVVTATRRAETVRDVPFNIQAISSESLQKIGAVNIADYARTVPGLSFTDGGARGGVTLVLRGLRTGSEAGLSPTTTVYLDEVPMDLPFRGSPLDLKIVDVERVEVLRGPQGTLFGGGAIGGTLRYISKKPNFDGIEGRMGGRISGTRHGGVNYDLTGTINLPVNDWIAIRTNVGHFDNDGFIDNIVTGENNVNDDRTTSARVAILMKPTEKLDINLSYHRQAARYGVSNTVRESQQRLTVDYTLPFDTRYRAQLFNMTLGYDFGWANLTSSTSYVDERLLNTNDSTFGIRDSIIGSFIPPELLPRFTALTERDARSRAFTQEVRLVSNSDGPFAWIVGGYFNRVSIHELQQERVPIPFPGQADFERDVIGAPLNDDKEYSYESNNRSRQFAVFGELKYNFTDAWQASVGGRYFWVRGTGQFYSIDQWFGPNARDANGLARTTPLPQEFSFGRYRENGSVFRFNTSYKFGGDGLVYVTVAQGFRPGGFNLISPNTGIPPEGRQFLSDDLISYEIGGKFSLMRNKIYVSSALFRIDWKDIQTTVRTPLGFSYLGNAGKAVSQGVEVELNTRDILIPGLQFNLGYSYTNAKLKQTIERIGFKGERTPLVPRHTLSLMGDYSMAVGDGLTLGLNWLTSYTSRAYGDFGLFKPVRDPTTGDLVASPRANDQYLPLHGYWLTNASLRLEGGSWTVRLFAENLLDARFTTARTFVPARSPYNGSDVTYSANRPRTVGLEFSKRF